MALYRMPQRKFRMHPIPIAAAITLPVQVPRINKLCQDPLCRAFGDPHLVGDLSDQ